MGTGTMARYTLEFKLEALRLAKTGQNIAATAKILGLSEQTLHNTPDLKNSHFGSWQQTVAAMLQHHPDGALADFG